MKFIVGLLMGAMIVWGWFDKYGRLQRTDVVIETRTNVVTSVKYETVYTTQNIYQTVWQTNTVTMTNIVEASPVPEPSQVNVMYIPSTPVRTPSSQPRQQPAYNPPAPTKAAPVSSEFRGPRNLPGRDRHGNTTNRNVHIRM